MTYSGGVPGLWSAVRQEGFTRLAAPELYRALSHARADLADAPAADATFDRRVTAAARARDEDRLDPATDPRALATRYWAAGHGLVSLVVQGVLPEGVLAGRATDTAVALLTAAGDAPARCRGSVERARAG